MNNKYNILKKLFKDRLMNYLNNVKIKKNLIIFKP